MRGVFFDLSNMAFISHTHTHEEGAGRAISRIIHRMKPPLSRSEISFYSTEVYADMRYAAAAVVNARFYGNNSLSLPGLHSIKQDGGGGRGKVSATRKI